MKKVVTSALFILAASACTQGLAQSWTNAYEDGLASSNMCQSLGGDVGGSSAYVGGKYSLSTTFGSTTLSNSGGTDAFLTRLSSTAVMWAVSANGPGNEEFDKVLFLGSDILVYGTRTGAITFHGTSGSMVSLTGSGGFIARFSSGGLIKSALSITETVQDLDGTGIAGKFCTIGSAPSGGNSLTVNTYSLGAPAISLLSTITCTTSGYCKGDGVALDASNNVYFLADATGNFNIPGSGITAMSGQDLIMVKYNSAGTFQWYKKVGNPGTTNEFGVDLDFDGSGFYITGYYGLGSIQMDPPSTSYTLSNSGGADMFLAKYSDAGVIQWAKKIGGAQDDVPLSLSLNLTYPTVAMRISPIGAVTFTSDICPTAYNFTASGNNWYCVQYNGSGSQHFAMAPVSGGSSNNNLPVTTGSNGLNTIIVAGNNNAALDFSGTTVGNGGVYQARATVPSCRMNMYTGIEEEQANDLFSVYPNPSAGIFTLTSADLAKGTIEVYDISGKKVKSVTLDEGLSEYKLDLSTLDRGIYMLNVISGDKINSKKIIIE